ncbi:hypothetical protein B7R54_07695 [Subtercola boreus]|uniref:Lactococcin 972 family bacteriocin n=1 Tax=Subtercola boreus TaxID=120213 RepID=A0A3E0VHC3_9MICO|nr:hypothetical protein [Subtercola boreus]RFA09121.1 hypothetical protein B7R54_07695 [Subtercola boreus]TQL53869.1 hypothetical protein FB464_1388 [Subtercola boreus]
MKSLPATAAALVVAAGLVFANATGASATTIDFGSQVCGWGGPSAASTAYINATSVHQHQANAVSWTSRTFGSGFHRFSSGNGVVSMQISYPSGTETGRAFSCANGSF